MAETTLKAILDRFQAVLEASPCSLTASTLPFSHDRQPNQAIEDRYVLEDAGLVSNASVGNHRAARITRIRIWVAKKTKFDGVTAFEAMETLFNTIERAIIADGPGNSYHAALESHRTSSPAGRDLVIGELVLTADFDYAETAS